MKIGLIDVDGHNFPNLALMKISAFHKAQSDNVEFVNLFEQYDIVYQSKVFTFTNDFEYIPMTKKHVKGGTGYNLTNKLPDEVESMFPDYSLYPQYKEAYGYLTRGCPRRCPFCIVGEKEGTKVYKVADLNHFWMGQKEIKLLDPNLLASKEHNELLQQLIYSKAYVDFTQGLDARLLTDANIDLISRVKLKMVHFAWDMMGQSELIISNLKRFKEVTKIDERKARVYVLTNYNTSEQEDLYRIYTLRDMGYDPYVMIYEKWNASKRLKQMQRWVNNKYIWRSCKEFEEYVA